mmetsp:Transcript_23687/g.26853  ORF Transcript_23687/g.26853 Transcript_23687/m.26853 type:complete len:87 (-) Transcript_23687:342-602(-)
MKKSEIEANNTERRDMLLLSLFVFTSFASPHDGFDSKEYDLLEKPVESMWAKFTVEIAPRREVFLFLVLQVGFGSLQRYWELSRFI